jgi:hypothetical protein
MEASVFLALVVNIQERNYLLSGVVREGSTTLECSADAVAELLLHLVEDAQLVQAVKPLLPEKMTLRVTLPGSKAAEGHIIVELVVEWDNGSSIRVLKGKEGACFQLWLNRSIGLRQLPLVGEFFDEATGISGLELAYLPGNVVPADLQERLQSPLVARHPGHRLKWQKGFNLRVEYQALQELPGLYTYAEVQPQAVPIAKERAAAPSPVASPQAQNASSPVRVYEIQPKVDREQQQVRLTLSALLTISRFNFEVIGLEISIPFSAFRQLSFPTLLQQTAFRIRGLSIAYNSPAFSLAGAFYRDVTDGQEEYNGLLTIRIRQLELIALGSYIKTPTYNSVFAFGYLGIPIPGHPAFELQGIALGFGLNRSFLLPDIREVSTFPLISLVKHGGLPPGTGVKQVFALLNRYIPPKADAYTLIAGIRFRSFKMIDTIALVAVNLEKGVVISLLGLSNMRLPGTYEVEMAFSLLLDFRAGVALARGELTPASYILFPGARLRGGFAFGLWFAGEQSGDFVLSAGGYHPEFNVPAHYPKDIPRLGIAYSLSEDIFLAGNLYFALTPQCIMAGIEGLIRYRKQLDYAIDLWIKTITVKASVEVSLYFSADFLIYWRPFYYTAGIQVRVFASLKVDCSFLTLQLQFNLSASLRIWGPDFSGQAFLSVAGYTIEVGFGQAPRSSPVLDKNAFRAAFLPEKVLSVNITQGILHKPQEGEDGVVVVNPEAFLLEITSQVPLSDIGGDLEGIEQEQHQAFGVAYDRPGANGQPFGNKLILTLNGNIRLPVTRVIRQSVPKALWSQRGADGRSMLAGSGLVEGVTTGLQVRFPSASGHRLSGQVTAVHDACVFTVQDATPPLPVTVDPDATAYAQLLMLLQEDAQAFGRALLEGEEKEAIDASGLATQIPAYRYKGTVYCYTI